jgi:hypothetical protein
MSAISHPLTILPSVLLHTEWFAVLSAFVALNTIMYVALAVGKVLPKVYVSDWVRSRNRRSQTRSIYPDGYVVVAEPGVDSWEVLLDRAG